MIELFMSLSDVTPDSGSTLGDDLLASISKDKQVEKKIKETRKKKGKPGIGRTLVLIFALAITLVLAVLFPPKLVRAPHPMYVGDTPSRWTGSLDDVLNDLWEYREAISQFRLKNKGSYPSSMDDLLKIRPELPRETPHSGKPYLYERKGDKEFLLTVPDPSKLGVTTIRLSASYVPPEIVK